MNNLLYTYEEVCDLIRERDLKQFEREDAEDKFLWQFSKTGSTLKVRTIMQSRYVVDATEKDFNLLKRKADAAGVGIVITESKKDMIELMVSQYEEVVSKAILFVKNGNKVLNLETFDRHQPHEVFFFTNENLELVLDWLKESESTASKTSKAAKTPAPVRYVPVKEKQPEMTDDEVRDVFPEGCAVFHPYFGEGTVEAISGGKIAVLFEDETKKIFAARVCIEKQLLELA